MGIYPCGLGMMLAHLIVAGTEIPVLCSPLAELSDSLEFFPIFPQSF